MLCTEGMDSLHAMLDSWTAMQVVLDTVTVVLALDTDPSAASGDEADATDGPLQSHQGTYQLRITT